MSAKKPASVKPSSKKTARPAATHPTWVDMIKECIAVNKDDARHGVSRPQIKKYVETEYKLEIGAAQNTQLSKALSTGTDKGIFVLPKGPSGRVKLAPKAKSAESSATKENKPAAKPKAITAKPKSGKTATAKVTSTKSRTTVTKPAATKKTPTSKTAAAKKLPAPKKALAGKAKATTAKKATTTTKRGAAKKTVTGTTAPAKAKAAARKAPAKRTAVKPTAKPSSPRKKPTKRS